jgi:predicted anti-sigma-YlaC factor YlaD
MTKYMPGMLTCEEVDSFLYSYHQGELTYGEKLKFSLHLTMCRECKMYVSDYKNSVRLSKQGLKTAEPLEKVPEELVQIILKSRSTMNTKNNPNDRKNL